MAIDAIRRVGDLFTRQPARYGTRGDARVWQLLGADLANEPLPSNRWDLESVVEAAFERRVGVRPTFGAAPIRVDEVVTGSGMSDGMVSPDWWKQVALTLLIDRWTAATGTEV